MPTGPRSETVTTTATRLVNYDPERTSVLIHNNSTSTDVYFGVDSTVSTSTGMKIPPGAFALRSEFVGSDPRLALYFIVASGTAEIRILEGYIKNKV